MSAVDAYLRQQKIAQRLRLQGSVRIGPLLRDIGCSYATLVRDLNYMERDGRLQRVHGGIVAVPVHRRPDEHMSRRTKKSAAWMKGTGL